MSLLRRFLIVVAAFFALTTTAHAATLSPDGATSDTLRAAIVAGDCQITLAPGVYPSQAVENVWPSCGGPVVVDGRGAVIDGKLSFKNAHRVDVEDATVLNGVEIDSHKADSGPSYDITVVHSDITSSGACVSWQNIAQRISILGNRIHDCGAGLIARGRPSWTPSLQSCGVTVKNNVIEDIVQDAMQISDTGGLDIEDNVITRISDGDGGIHNDGIQTAGGVTPCGPYDFGAIIKGNSISYSSTQAIFLQDRNLDDDYRPMDHITVAENVTHNINDSDVQSQGVTNAVFHANAFCDGHPGWPTLWLRQGNAVRSDGTRSTPTDTVVTGNVIGIYQQDYPGAAAVFENNALGC